VGCCCVSGCAGVCNARLVGWGLPARRCLEACFLTRVGPATSADTSRRVCVARAALIDKRRPSRHRHCNSLDGRGGDAFCIATMDVKKKHEIEAALATEAQAISAGHLKEENPLDLSDDFRAFCEACRRGDLKVCQEKISEGVNINARDKFDYTPLILVGARCLRSSRHALTAVHEGESMRALRSHPPAPREWCIVRARYVPRRALLVQCAQ
jgi:hypothetical protein